MLSTALGVFVANPVHAQTVTQSGVGPQTYDNPGTIAGNPRAVAITSTNGGNVSATIGTVTSTDSSGQSLNIISLNSNGAGTVTGNVGNITSSGTGNFFGLVGQSVSGPVNLTVGTVDLAGSFTRGVYGTSAGNVTLTGTSVTSRGTGTLDNGNTTGEGLLAISTGGRADVTSNFASAAGGMASAAAAIGQTGAMVHSGDGRTTSGTSGATLYAQVTGAGDATIISNSTSSANTNGAYLLQALTANGKAGVTSTTATSTGANGSGLYAQGTAGVTIQSGTVSVSGIGIRGITTTGGVVINATGDTRSSGTYAMRINTVDADITTAANTITSGTNQTSMMVTATGTTTINNNGTVANTNGGSAINVNSTNGATTINSKTVTLTAAAALVNNAPGAGIYVASSNAGAVNITSDSVTLNGQGRDGILVQTNGAVRINSATVNNLTTVLPTFDLNGDIPTVAGIRVVGFEAQNSPGPSSVTINSGSVISANAPGIFVQTVNGNIDIASARAIASGAGDPEYQLATNDGIVAMTSGTGSVRLVSDYAQSDAPIGSAITVNAGGDVSISSNTAVINGGGGAGISAASRNGNLTLQAGSVTYIGSSAPLFGSYGVAIGVGATVGTATATVDSSVATNGIRTAGVSVTGGAGATLNLRTSIASGTAASVSSRAGDATLNISGAVERVQGTGTGTPSTTAAATVAAGIGTLNIAAGGSIKSFTAAVSMTDRTASTITNLGSITGGTDAVQFNGTATQTANAIVNSGLIKANGGIGVVINANATAKLVSTIANNAGGTIQGSTTGIADSYGALVLTNAGTIRGDGATPTGALANGGVRIQQANAVVNNSGTISGAGYGIVETTGPNATNVQEYRTANTQITNNGTIRGESNDGVAVYGTGTITNSWLIEGLADATRADGIQIQYYPGIDSGQPQNGTVVNLATGVVNGARYGVISASGGTITNAGTINGGVNGVLLTSSNFAGKTGTITNSGVINNGTVIGLSSATVTNSGTLANANGAALVAQAGSGAMTLVNSGTISGSAGIAAILSDAADRVELRTGSTINGVIDFAAGNDTLTLNGGGTGSVATQTLAASVNLETLNVASGYWTARTGVSQIGAITIASGSALEVLGQGGVSPIGTSPVAIDGTLVLNFTGGTAGTVASPLSGTGALRVVGTDGITLSSTANTFRGATDVSGGSLILTGNLAGTVTTAGNGIFRLGAGGVTGTFDGNLVNDGAFVYDRSDSYTLTGGVTGSGVFTKNGAGVLTIAGTYGFTGATFINGGSLTFNVALASNTELDIERGTVDLSGAPGGTQTIAELAGTSAGTIALGATRLTVNQTTSTEFAGMITGPGGLTKTGTGTLNLTAANSYGGTTQVSGGTLKVNGSLANSLVSVTTGGTLGGNGSVAGIAIQGGTLAPGNSIGRMTVNGNVSLNAASVYQVEANNSGQADRVDATGTAALGGARVQVLAASGVYGLSTSYTILTAAGGITGTFGSVTSNLAFLTPSLAYGTTGVTLTLARNNVAFATAGTNANERGAGAAVQALGAGNALFESTLTLDDASVAPALATLTGEVHAAAGSGLIEDTQPLRTTVLALIGDREEGVYGWASGIGAFQTFKRVGATAGLRNDLFGTIGGVGFAGDGIVAGVGGGFTKGDYRSGASASHADVDTALVVAYAGYAAGPLSVKVGGTIGFNTVDSTRFATVGMLRNTLRGRYDARTVQGFGEVAYHATVVDVVVTPFAGLAFVRTNARDFTETGGAAALHVAEQTRDVFYSTIGLRLAPLAFDTGGVSVKPYASGAWRHSFGDRTGVALANFVGGTRAFGVTGASIVQDAADIGGGVDVTKGRFGLRAAYTGIVGKKFSDHGAKATVSYRF